MFNTDHTYKIHWEITDLCNLKCPMCPRTDILNYCRPVKEIQNSQFFLKDIKEFFPDKFLRKIKRIDFCGNFGDPCIAQDFYEICEFLVKNYGITIMASTNGTMRNPSWWKKLGELLADTESWFEFHIDGLSDTNHLYRIGANWDKIMGNTEAFIAGGAQADWHYILFKHNQHQVDKAYAMARQMGFEYFVPTDTGRFPNEGKYRYLHPNGDWSNLEQATITVRHGIENSLCVHPQNESNAISENESNIKNIVSSASFTSINGIICKSASLNRFFLDSRGYIAPCCWVSNRDVERPGDMLKSVSISGKDKKIYNIRNRPIEEILSDDLFSEHFPKLWRSDKLATCRKKCGEKLRNYQFKFKL
jgi:MoaA/NifB/PqqE/SkfB family radical SAM enzyme